jgi:IS30 family transposase
MTDEMIKDATERHAAGECSAADIAAELGVSRATIFRYIKRNRDF